MRAIYPFLLAGALGFITMESYGQCANLKSDFDTDAVFTSDANCSFADDLTLSSNSSARKVEVKNDSDELSVTIDLNGNTLSLGGRDQAFNYPSGVNLIVGETDTLIINGNLYINTNSSVQVDGVLIVRGNVDTYDGTLISDYGTDNIGVNVGNSGIISVSGSADFGRATNENPQNIYATGGLDNRSGNGNFSNAIVGSDPFSTDKVLDFNELSASIDFWDESKLVAGDRSGNKISVYILNDLTVNSASGWYGKYLKVTAYGFDNNEIVLPNQSSLGKITSLQDLKDRIVAIKWEVKNQNVSEKLDHYHDNGKTDTKHLTKSENTTMQNYFSQSRKIVIEFVDTPLEAKASYENYPSNARLSAVNAIDEIEVENNMGDLPIILSTFSIGITEQQTVKLQWTSAMEINNDYYEVLRSVDQKNWESIGILDGAGNTTYAIDYTFVDEEPLFEAYYKLVQYDFDGQNESYGPLFIALEDDGVNDFQVNLYPNVINGNQVPNLSIQDVSKGNDILIQVYNNSGRAIYQEVIKNLAGNSLLKPVPLPSNLPSGMYYMVIKSGLKATKKKLVLQ
ncbi:T9SS type A sorting domain-containing protein [Flammeovirga sp. SJP92]|uniref:T9SS type A sorting domain-containing protein n=1 Tax=Flammeovirga sp. SJP92 TaxID=1775430 RepID=UPI00078805C1|nr:T9SS type A sorting domain-containing protein [Flammeovirga sp. SJP92]KXX68488.1 hypothetical protein AVL50_22235 [Flammeovirga sp. SJP92]